MLPACHGRLLAGPHVLPPDEERESDPECPPTPTPPACRAFIEGDGLASGRVTPTGATLADRSPYQTLCESVGRKLQHMQDQRQEEAGHDRKGLGGKTTYSSLRQMISAVGPPVEPSQFLSLDHMVPPPEEVQPQQASPVAPLGLGEPPSAAHEVVSTGFHWPATAAGAQPVPRPPLSASPWLDQAPPWQPAVSWEEPVYVHDPFGSATATAFGGVTASTAASHAEAFLAASIGTFPSLGSIGHPDSCGRACKYASKANGCKVGHLCNRCHLCRWTKSCDGARVHRRRGGSAGQGLVRGGSLLDPVRANCPATSTWV